MLSRGPAFWVFVTNVKNSWVFVTNGKNSWVFVTHGKNSWVFVPKRKTKFEWGTKTQEFLPWVTKTQEFLTWVKKTQEFFTWVTKTQEFLTWVTKTQKAGPRDNTDSYPPEGPKSIPEGPHEIFVPSRGTTTQIFFIRVTTQGFWNKSSPKNCPKTPSFYLQRKKSMSKQNRKMFTFGFWSFSLAAVAFFLHCGWLYGFIPVFWVQFDVKSLIFGFESFILRNLRSNFMKNSAIEKKFATLMRKHLEPLVFLHKK